MTPIHDLAEKVRDALVRGDRDWLEADVALREMERQNDEACEALREILALLSGSGRAGTTGSQT